MSACSGARAWEDPSPATPLVESFEASAEVVFSALPDILRRMSLGPATRMDTENLVIETTRDVSFSRSVAGPSDSPIVRCQVMAEVSGEDGSIPWLRRGEVSGPGIATIRVRVEPAGEGSVARITMVGAPGGRATVVGTSDAVGAVAPSCYSTGVVESQIADAIRAAVDPDYDPPEPTPRRPF